MHARRSSVYATAVIAGTAALLAVVAAANGATRPIGASDPAGDAYLACSERELLIDRNSIAQTRGGREKRFFVVSGWARTEHSGEDMIQVRGTVRRNGKTRPIGSDLEYVTTDGFFQSVIAVPGSHAQIKNPKKTKLFAVLRGAGTTSESAKFKRGWRETSQAVTFERGWIGSHPKTLDRGESRMRAFSNRGELHFRGVINTAKPAGRPDIRFQERISCRGKRQWQTLEKTPQPKDGTYYRTIQNPPSAVSGVLRARTRFATHKGDEARKVTISPMTAVTYR